MRHMTTGMIAALLLGAPAFTGAQEDLPRVQPEAKALLDEVVAAYGELPSYVDQGVFTIGVTVDGESASHEQPMAMALDRPDRFALEAGGARLVSDGETLATVVEPTRSYLVEPAPERVTAATVSEGPVGAMILGGPGGVPASILLNLLLDDDPAAAILAGGVGLRAAPDAEVEGAAVRTLVLDPGVGPDYLLRIDPDSKLLRRIDVVVEPEAVEADAPAGATLREVELSWSAGEVATLAPAPARFAFEAPIGFARVEALEAGDAAPDAAEPRHRLVGQPAPEFTITALTGDGEAKPISKADLAGKVVLIDFWATWCPPCLKELPEIAGLIDRYAEEGADVVVLAVSEDRGDDPDEPVRGLVEQTLADRDLALIRPPVGLVALDPTGAMGTAFGVRALPTVVLLDQEGVVQSVQVGYREGVADILRRDIGTLLEGKSLVEPEAPDAGEGG